MSFERALIAQAQPYMVSARARALVREEEVKGCQATISRSPVSLEPNFEPIGDTRKGLNVSIRQPWTREVFQGPEELVRLRIWVSTEQKFDWIRSELFIKQLQEMSSRAGFEVAGNNEDYNIHFRTSDLWFPWQSYRASFKATSDWQTIRIPFSDLDAYKTSQKFRQNKLKRIGLVGIGRDFLADLCLASIRFYSEDN